MAAANKDFTKSNIETSPQDERLYHSFHIPKNKLHVLLISDPTTDKSSASLEVRVGYLSDPYTIPGLAHFLEHMLFMGTKKYPLEDEYESYLSKHGGSSNAYTGMENTNYFFDVSVDKFEGALDRFAQFFIEPLFNPSSIEREINAISSEFGKNLQSDAWRELELLKLISSKVQDENKVQEKHPVIKFGIGNKETLVQNVKEQNIDLRKELLDFHKRYYSGNIMKLVVLGKEDLSTLYEYVMKYFEDIPTNENISIPIFPGTPFGSKTSKRAYMIPVRKETTKLELNFPTREINTLYECKPLQYISHLIGHEGNGSILAYLKKLGYANELSAGESHDASDWAIFNISVEMTKLGLENVEEIIQVIFAFIHLLNEIDVQEWVFEETKNVANCRFRFLSKRDPIDYTCTLSTAMHVYPEDHIISGMYKIYKYDPDVIRECMAFLKPSNVIILLQSQTFASLTTSEEYWFKTKYHLEDINETTLKKYQDVTHHTYKENLYLPAKNDMIATDFTLKEITTQWDTPKLLLDTNKCRLWYKPDTFFKMPKLNVIISIQTPLTYESPKASVLSRLYVQILQDYITDFSYQASVASLYCYFTNSRKGIELHLSGYNHKLSILLSHIIQAMVELPTFLLQDGRELYSRIKEKTLKQYSDFYFYPPYRHAINYLDQCLETHKWDIDDKILVLENGIEYDEVINFSRDVLKEHFLEMIVHGNATSQDAIDLSNIVFDALPKKDTTIMKAYLPEMRVIKLQKEYEYILSNKSYNPEETNNSVLVCYQIDHLKNRLYDNDDIKKAATLSLLHHLMKEPVYDDLRTKQQLGYIVHASERSNGVDCNVMSLIVLIQSDEYDCVHVNQCIETFIQQFRGTIASMSNEAFQENVIGLQQIYYEKFKNLNEETSYYWNAISNTSYHFEKNKVVGDTLNHVSKEDVLQFYDKYILDNDNNCRKKFNVHVIGKNHLHVWDNDLERWNEEKDDDTKVKRLFGKEVFTFKSNMALYPLPYVVDVNDRKVNEV